MNEIYRSENFAYYRSDFTFSFTCINPLTCGITELENEITISDLFRRVLVAHIFNSIINKTRKFEKFIENVHYSDNCILKDLNELADIFEYHFDIILNVIYWPESKTFYVRNFGLTEH